MNPTTQSPRKGPSYLKTVGIAAFVAVVVSMCVCPSTRPRPFVKLLGWAARVAPVVVPFFLEEPRQDPIRTQDEVHQRMLANREPERVVSASGTSQIDHKYGW